MSPFESHDNDIDTESAEPLTLSAEAIMSVLNTNQARNFYYDSDTVAKFLGTQLAFVEHEPVSVVEKHARETFEYLMRGHYIDDSAYELKLDQILEEVQSLEA